MVKDYLNSLKTQGNFSWSELSKLSGLPDTTIRKVFSGETADPRFETVAKLVTAMGGSMNDIIAKPKEEELEATAIIAIREVYEARIDDLKTSSTELINTLRRDKKYLAVISCILGVVLIGFLIVDIMVGSVGWIRY